MLSGCSHYCLQLKSLSQKNFPIQEIYNLMTEMGQLNVNGDSVHVELALCIALIHCTICGYMPCTIDFRWAVFCHALLPFEGAKLLYNCFNECCEMIQSPMPIIISFLSKVIQILIYANSTWTEGVKWLSPNSYIIINRECQKKAPSPTTSCPVRRYVILHFHSCGQMNRTFLSLNLQFNFKGHLHTCRSQELKGVRN